MTTDPTPDESRWGGPKVALGAILAGAAALRLVGIEYGLPHANLLNPDEAELVPRAWAIAQQRDFDPHPFFDYPSLLLYVLAPFQAWHDAPDVLTARVAAVVIGVAGVAAAWWLGSSAYHRVAGGVAAVTTGIAGVHVAYSRAAVTDVLLTTLVTVALALLVTRKLELAGLVAGLAAGAKYPGALVLVPILVVGWGAWRRVAAAAACAVVGFVAATPFAVVHAGEAASDLWRLQRRHREGWLGFENDPFSAFAFAGHLWEALGPALVVAAVGLVAALVLRTTPDRALAAFALVYFASLLPLASHFDRYVLPLVPVLAVLAGRLRSLAPVTLLLLVVPFVSTVRATETLTKPDTRAIALERVELEAAQGVVAFDPGLPEPKVERLRLVLPLPGEPADPARATAGLRGFGTRPTHVWVNGSVADRVRAAPGEYPEEIAFYRRLQREARLVFRLEPGDDRSGPWTALYELDRDG